MRMILPRKKWLTTALIVVFGIGSFSVAQEPGLHQLWSQNDNYDQGSGFGNCISGAGDFNGDGIPDVVAGYPLNSTVMVSYHGTLGVFSGKDGEILLKLDGQNAGERLGTGVAGNGDVNGDGISDIAASSPGASRNGPSGAGIVEVLSGRTGALIQVFEGLAKDENLGNKLSFAGDINADGNEDIIFSNSSGIGVYSILSGTQLYQFDDGIFTQGRDVDGDGHADILIGNSISNANGLESGNVILYSGSTGLPLWQTNGIYPAQHLGKSVSIIDDANDDGFPDVLVGLDFQVDNGTNPGAASILDGLTGIELFAYQGTIDQAHFGAGVGNLGDVNGDGISDFGISTTYYSVWEDPGGYVQVYSGDTMQPMFEVLGEPGGELGTCMAGLGDIDGDGIDDFAFGAPGDYWQMWVAFIFTYSYNPYLSISTDSLSASNAGSPAQLRITFGLRDSMRPYRILLSYSGIGPTTVNGFEIPLGFDNALLAGFSGWTPRNSDGFKGQLDAKGIAAATISSSPELSPWIGTTFHLAAVSLEWKGSVVIGRVASVPCSLTITP